MIRSDRDCSPAPSGKPLLPAPFPSLLQFPSLQLHRLSLIRARQRRRLYLRGTHGSLIVTVVDTRPRPPGTR